MITPRPLTFLAVVIPARNEEELVGRCLDALAASIHYAHRMLGPSCPQVYPVVVVDSSHDNTAPLARQSGIAHVIEVASANVGAARACGVAHALAVFREGAHRDDPTAEAPDLSTAWIANTDADSAVPVNWIATQIAFADEGADVVLGTVRPDFADLTPAQTAAWQATHTPGLATGHIHGANLGLRARTYELIGAFSPLDEHEDIDLVARARQHNALVRATAKGEVLTSGRQQGRTPGGYAGFLRTELLS